ncbi:MAG: magnesium transporter [Rikenellaceae bacterium]|jgi:magnesium transporter|nr:magnesium transporter [Rikenellaceae bacterium]
MDILVKHPADIAEQFSALDEKERNLAFMLLPGRDKGEVFPYFDLATQEELARSLGDKELAETLNNLEPDDRTALFEDFPDDLIKYCVNLLEKKQREIALNLIGYRPDSVARLMTPLYIQVRPEWSVERALQHIKRYGKKAETLNFIYVVDRNNRLIDDLRIGQLLLADNSQLIIDLMDSNFISIVTTTPIEQSLEIFDKYDRAALPIVSENGTLVGIVTIDDILDQIKERDTEDIQKFGGVQELDMSYTRTPLTQLVKKRAGWLVVLFLSEMLTASAMGYFDAEIERAVVLALFVPLIISSGGNSGSQAASLIIRSLALGELKLRDWWYVMRKEALSGLMLGAILGAIGFVRILVWQQTGLFDYGPYWEWVGISVATSLVLIVLWGTLSGSLIPLLLKRCGLDPATASAPFVATLVDVTGLLIYFTIAAMFLTGKIL